jgi:hypothetical protein
VTGMATEIQDCEKVADLYEKDFYAWALEQARQLRAIQESRPNLPLDFEHLIEEVEDLARSDLRTARSQLRRLVEHLLKLEHSPAGRPRQQWLKGVDNARSEIADVLTRSLVKSVEPDLDDLYNDGRDAARRDLAGFGETEAAKALPDTCPYTFEQLLTKRWYPANRHGLVDDPL